MKTMKYILLFVVCVTMAACGNEMDNYKDKILEYTARKHKTTPEHLVKDFDISIDSMSVSPFILQDSIDYVNQNYEIRKKPFDESISFEKERIEKLSEALEKEKRKKGNYSHFGSILKQNIYDARNKLARAEENHKILTEQYESDMARFEGRNAEEAIYNMFWYRVAIKNPLSKVHEVSSEVALFSLDGKLFIKNINGSFKEFLLKRKSENK